MESLKVFANQEKITLAITIKVMVNDPFIISGNVREKQPNCT